MAVRKMVGRGAGRGRFAIERAPDQQNRDGDPRRGVTRIDAAAGIVLMLEPQQHSASVPIPLNDWGHRTEHGT